MSTVRDVNVLAKTVEKPLIMVVDDELSICQTMAKVLGDEGYPTVIAQSGAEALQKLVEHQPALVFLDIWMPGVDGLETLAKLKELSPETEVVMISGHATIANALEATKRGAFDFIEKPLTIENILLSVEKALLWRQEQASGQPNNKVNGEIEELDQENRQLRSHPGVLSRGLAGRNIGQRTLKESAIIYGQGLHSGSKSGLVLEPLPRNSGIHFGAIGDSASVPAFVDFVESTSFATSIRRSGVMVSTIEHLMATLHAYRLSNLLIKCNREVPILDGSALELARIIEEAGIEEQGGEWYEVAPREPIIFATEEKMQDGQPKGEQIVVEAADVLTLCYELDYPEPVGRQYYEFVLRDVDAFKREVAPARTFGFMKDIERMQRAGLAAGGRLDNFILVGPDKVLNTELRFPDELARHKILDLLGDLFLLGRPFCARIRARMTGHSDNYELVRKLRELVCGNYS